MDRAARQNELEREYLEWKEREQGAIVPMFECKNCHERICVRIKEQEIGGKWPDKISTYACDKCGSVWAT